MVPNCRSTQVRNWNNQGLLEGGFTEMGLKPSPGIVFCMDSMACRAQIGALVT